MKSILKYIIPSLLIIFTLSSCLDGDDANIPDKASGSFIEMIYNPDGSKTTINSGLQYFTSAALSYPATDIADTATFVVSIQAVNPASKDITVTMVVDNSSLNANYKIDSITYLAMPDSLYDFVNETAVIKKGEWSTKFQIIFYPSKIDATQFYNLPITTTNDNDIIVSSNFGHIYFHTIANPYAGAYVSNYTLERQGNSPQNFTEDPKNLEAVDAEVLKAFAGYAYFGNSDIKFRFSVNPDNTVKITSDPDAVKAGITIVPTSGTTSTYDPLTKTFHLYYEYVNGSGLYRKFDEILVKK